MILHKHDTSTFLHLQADMLTRKELARHLDLDAPIDLLLTRKLPYDFDRRQTDSEPGAGIAAAPSSVMKEAHCLVPCTLLGRARYSF